MDFGASFDEIAKRSPTSPPRRPFAHGNDRTDQDGSESDSSESKRSASSHKSRPALSPQAITINLSSLKHALPEHKDKPKQSNPAASGLDFSFINNATEKLIEMRTTSPRASHRDSQEDRPVSRSQRTSQEKRAMSPAPAQHARSAKQLQQQPPLTAPAASVSSSDSEFSFDFTAPLKPKEDPIAKYFDYSLTLPASSASSESSTVSSTSSTFAPSSKPTKKPAKRSKRSKKAARDSDDDGSGVSDDASDEDPAALPSSSSSHPGHNHGQNGVKSPSYVDRTKKKNPAGMAFSIRPVDGPNPVSPKLSAVPPPMSTAEFINGTGAGATPPAIVLPRPPSSSHSHISHSSSSLHHMPSGLASPESPRSPEALLSSRVETRAKSPSVSGAAARAASPAAAGRHSASGVSISSASSAYAARAMSPPRAPSRGHSTSVGNDMDETTILARMKAKYELKPGEGNNVTPRGGAYGPHLTFGEGPIERKDKDRSMWSVTKTERGHGLSKANYIEWKFVFGGEVHEVQLEHEYLNGKRIIKCDGNLVTDTRKIFGSKHEFPVGVRTRITCRLEIKESFNTITYELEVGGATFANACDIWLNSDQ